MRLLILGGTAFVGRHAVEAALARGHEVTLFNRGRRNPDLFPELERLRGERPDDLGALRGRRWDAVLDTSGYTPRAVAASAGLLAGTVEHYTFVSTLSVYADPVAPETDEAGRLGSLPPEKEGTEEVDGETYGPLKVLAERAAEAAMPGRVLTVRAGLIVGPYDTTDRFTYWPTRVARGGEVLAPDAPDRPIQFIDVRDLVAWMLDMAEARRVGVFNVTGPGRRLAFGELLETCQSVSDSDARFTWVDEKTLLAHNVGPYAELPLWVPREAEAFGRMDNRKAIGAGLSFRPLSDTVRDTLAWDKARPQDMPRQNGMSQAREGEILTAWHAAKTSSGEKSVATNSTN